ncbi:conserved protein of unknown function [Tenacibaculum sp. 190524A02b]|uniref:DUF1853 family protein n=1 Tax=Tenacibaculum vairaonense TaxID=3137860 RepID=UPI0032B1B3F2
MHFKTKELQLQYEGFLKTPFLWTANTILDIIPFEIPSTSSSFSSEITQRLRLGKLVERFVSFELEQLDFINILAENIQIQKDKITLGELDCILLKNNVPIHLEIVYKFYLYDNTVGNSEIEHWIGPNRKDSFIQKLTKLQQKQFPLLHTEECKLFLKTLSLDTTLMQQQTYFKAQLFVPLKVTINTPTLINPKCIIGFYCTLKELTAFSNCKFYIPSKHNWLVWPHTHVNWLGYTDFLKLLSVYLAEQNAPLCWLKKPNGELVKFFVVWW